MRRSTLHPWASSRFRSFLSSLFAMWLLVPLCGYSVPSVPARVPLTCLTVHPYLRLRNYLGKTVCASASHSAARGSRAAARPRGGSLAGGAPAGDDRLTLDRRHVREDVLDVLAVDQPVTLVLGDADVALRPAVRAVDVDVRDVRAGDVEYPVCDSQRHALLPSWGAGPLVGRAMCLTTHF
ncbi:hypothetical protein MICRO80W_540017 [Micrococcus luteus]|nr:hypothetical protein MICRO80W_540017 [Micrococcus luteus]